ncbi:IPT/TIG domain-containing protein, partial [Paenibacillus arenosi]
PGGFTYNPLPVIDPTITSVTPNNGAMAGYYYITIQGKDFDRKTTVYIDDQAATSTYMSATELSVQVPAGKRSGAVDVKVVTGAKGTATMTGGFTYNAPGGGGQQGQAPTITGITPNSGAMGGYYYITIKGTGFDRGTKVTIDDQAANTTYISATELSVMVPTGKRSGAVDVKVVTGKQGTTTMAGGFTYNVPGGGGQQGQAPTITSVTPNSGAMGGYYYITIKGTGFDRGTKVTIDDQEAVTTYISATELSVMVPRAKRSGAVDVKIVTGAKGTVTLAGGFTYR